ncbi:hypothetical protein HJG60_009581 [Phyllostomus discolor]|uniref:Uncharacterized protein n=1 Tax=Phyllostomus discolor TaxID=89673 RepID=A0A833YFL2_9CHIR|nr:hypothetical protein HJG60_009581 [Phyllostomus discolor]
MLGDFLRPHPAVPWQGQSVSLGPLRPPSAPAPHCPDSEQGGLVSGPVPRLSRSVILNEWLLPLRASEPSSKTQNEQFPRRPVWRISNKAPKYLAWFLMHESDSGDVIVTVWASPDCFQLPSVPLGM